MNGGAGGLQKGAYAQPVQGLASWLGELGLRTLRCHVNVRWPVGVRFLIRNLRDCAALKWGGRFVML